MGLGSAGWLQAVAAAGFVPGASGGGSSVPADLTALWTALGVQPTGWWSSRAGTTGTTHLTAWQDVRGAGFGGTATAPGAGPAFSGTTITFANLATDYMAVPASASFDLSTGGTFVVVATVQTGGTTDRVLVSISENSLTRILGVGGGSSGAQSGPGGEARGSATLVYVHTAVVASTTRRLCVFSRNATTSVQCNVPAQAQATGTTDAAASGNLGLAFGDYFKSTSVGQGAFGFGTLFEVGWFRGVQFTSGQVTSTHTWSTGAPINTVDG